MNTIEMLGWFALVVSVIFTSFGIPVQIVKNYKNKSTEGLSLWLFAMMFVTYLSWALYAYAHTPPNWFIFVPNSIGLAGGVVIMWQFFIYREFKSKIL